MFDTFVIRRLEKEWFEQFLEALLHNLSAQRRVGVNGVLNRTPIPSPIFERLAYKNLLKHKMDPPQDFCQKVVLPPSIFSTLFFLCQKSLLVTLQLCFICIRDNTDRFFYRIVQKFCNYKIILKYVKEVFIHSCLIRPCTFPLQETQL